MSTPVDAWVRYDESNPGTVWVYCALCGRKDTRKSFHASSLNYAEMHRLATEYHSTHRLSDMHARALAAYNSDDVPPLDPTEALLISIFGEKAPTERELRRRAAKDAARRG